MSGATVCSLAMVILLWSTYVRAVRDSGHHRKIVIHVPYYIKNHHHTHTVFKYIKDRHHPEKYEDYDGQDGHENYRQQEDDEYQHPDDGYVGELQYDPRQGMYGPHPHLQREPHGPDQEGLGDHAHLHTTFVVRHHDGHLLQDDDSHESHEVIGHGHGYEGHHSDPGEHMHPMPDGYTDHGDNQLGQQEGDEEDGPHLQDGGASNGYVAHHERYPSRRRRKRGHKKQHRRPAPTHSPLLLDEELRPPKYDIMEPPQKATTVRKRAVATMKSPPGRKKHGMPMYGSRPKH